jgi:hypothetical protein
MRPFLARLSESVWSGHLPSLADFITTTPVFRFSVHTGDGWAELQDDGSIEGEICLVNGDDIPFIARRSKTSSTAC